MLGEIKKGTRSLSITDLEECPKASEEERDEENLDAISSDSDSLYDTDLEEEFSGNYGSLIFLMAIDRYLSGLNNLSTNNWPISDRDNTDTF